MLPLTHDLPSSILLYLPEPTPREAYTPTYNTASPPYFISQGPATPLIATVRLA
jgi:hypothetical protein